MAWGQEGRGSESTQREVEGMGVLSTVDRLRGTLMAVPKCVRCCRVEKGHWLTLLAPESRTETKGVKLERGKLWSNPRKNFSSRQSSPKTELAVRECLTLEAFELSRDVPFAVSPERGCCWCSLGGWAPSPEAALTASIS